MILIGRGQPKVMFGLWVRGGFILLLALINNRVSVLQLVVALWELLSTFFYRLRFHFLLPIHQNRKCHDIYQTVDI